MNLTRALDVALPEIPARVLSTRAPRVDPGTTFREHVEDGARVVRVYTPASGFMFKLTPQQWALAQLFDGSRSFAQIAEAFSTQTGEYYDEQSVAEFSAELDAANFWYQTAQEKNVLLLLQSKEERRKNLKARSRRFADLSMIIFPAFNPDRGLTWIYQRTRWIYSWWFTAITLLAFAFTFAISITHWSEIGRDTVEFYNFTDKSASDVAVLYLLGIFVVAAHEYAHAHACKHCGGRVPAMGFALIMLTPAFYTDTTEGAVMGDRAQRLVIALAGIWVELIICSIATPVWWLSEPGTMLHDGAYFLMMLTGIVSLVVNWNPLIKLDGYHMMCEIIGVPDLKEESTAWLSAWVKKHVWRLPVEVPYVPKRRRPGYAVYALLSGAYSYTVMTFLAKFAGNVSRNFSPEWAFLPDYGITLLIFKSRIRLLFNFLKLVYLDKKERVRAWLRSYGALAAGSLILIVLLLPVWHERTTGPFTLEPTQLAVVRAAVPGVVEDLHVTEGVPVVAGQPLARLRNLALRSELAAAQARLAAASSRATSAQLRYQDLGEALREKERYQAQAEQLRQKAAHLEIVSPIAGTVLTARPEDLRGSYLPEGAELLEVADLSRFRARIFVSEYDLYKVAIGAPARLQVEGLPQTWASEVAAIAPVSRESDPTLIEESKLKGLHPPQFYIVELRVPAAPGLKPGMTGTARVYGRRRTLAALAWDALRVVLGRKIW